MIPLSTVESVAALNSTVTGAALVDLQSLLAATRDMEPTLARKVLFEAFPDVFTSYATATSDIAATFYEETRVAAGVKSAYTAQTLTEAAPIPRLNALVGFGTASFEQGVNALMFQALSGGLIKMFSEISADTIIGNAARDNEIVGYQRVPARGCCAFCGLLASQGVSGGGLLEVVGRGKPVPSGPKRKGGQARGIGARGSRAIGELFHDNCRCTSVPVFRTNSVQMQSDAEEYYDSYRDSYDKVMDGYQIEHTSTVLDDGTVKKSHEWVKSKGPISSKQATKNTLAGMRAENGFR